jgi:hypothetical protein
LTILVSLLLVATLAKPRIAEQDDAVRVSTRGDEDDTSGNHDADETEETTTDEETIANAAVGYDQTVAGTQVSTIQNAWIHYFDAADGTSVEDMKRESGVLQEVDIQGTKEYFIVYKHPGDFSTAEEILAATDNAVQSIVVGNGGSITYEYNAALNGVSAFLTNEAMQELMKQGGIDFIEEVVPMSMITTWGQDRVDETDLTSSKLDYKWKGNKSVGAGVNVCVRFLFSASMDNLLTKHRMQHSTTVFAFAMADCRYRCR